MGKSEFEQGAGFEGAFGLALVMALILMGEPGFTPLAVPICTHAVIHLIARVLSLRSQAARKVKKRLLICSHLQQFSKIFSPPNHPRPAAQ